MRFFDFALKGSAQNDKSVLAAAEGAEIGQIEGAAALLGALAAKIYDAKLGLVLGDIVKEGVHKAFCVFRSHDYAVTHHSFGKAGKSGCKIQDKLTA